MKDEKYIIEYYVDLKYIGKIVCNRIDNRIIGYAGKTKHIAENTFLVGNKKITKDTIYETIYYKLTIGK
jgi:rRNA processing protein Krr1/Pno1